jgi:hypothetical protein
MTFGFYIPIEEIGNIATMQLVGDRVFYLVDFFDVSFGLIVVGIARGALRIALEVQSHDEDTHKNTELIHNQRIE